jgi:hypothetical protein
LIGHTTRLTKMLMYYVSSNGEQKGPWTLDEVLTRVKASELTMLDYIFDESKNDWVTLMEHPQLMEKLKSTKPPSVPKPRVELSAVPNGHHQVSQAAPPPVREEPKVAEWFVLKGENKFGPFSYPDLIKMLQRKLVYEFDFAWKQGMETWSRIAELPEFSEDKIRELKGTLMPEISELFFRRRHRRVRYGGTILVHDNRTVWKGRGVEISQGGAGVIMENSTIVPGQKLYLHFKPGDGVPPFNAICEVVSKRFQENVKEKASPVRYGLKFTSMNEETRKFLADFAKKADAA